MTFVFMFMEFEDVNAAYPSCTPDNTARLGTAAGQSHSHSDVQHFCLYKISNEAFQRILQKD